MGICFLFPGQGSQKVGMGKNIYDKYKSSREIFHTSNKILGCDITDLIFNGPEEELKKTVHCQPAILLVNLAYFQALKEKNIKCSLTMGHSVGEYSALVASNALSLEDAVKLVKIRAEAMSKSIPKEDVADGTSHMAAVITDLRGLVYEACEKSSTDGSIVQVANINSPSQIVISGNNIALIRAAEYLKEKEITKIVYLTVEGPFHSKLMKPAANRVRIALKEIQVRKPTTPYITNFSADFVYKPSRIKKMLVKQICGTVRWKQSLEKAIQEGYTTFVEAGYGKTQTNLLRRSYMGIEVLDKDTII